MGALADILDALNGRLAALPGLPPVAWENMEFNYTEGVPWVGVYNIPTDVSAAGPFAASKNVFSGIYQISVYWPANDGAYNPAVLADAIAAHFSRGDHIYVNTTDVTIRKCQVESPLMDTGWYVLPLSVYYTAYALNT